MAAKILALLVAFIAGVLTTWFFGARCISLAIRHVPWLREQFRVALHRLDEETTPSPIDVEYYCCPCGLPPELCTALAFLEIMCVAATRGEILNAQHASIRFLDLLNDIEGQ